MLDGHWTVCIVNLTKLSIHSHFFLRILRPPPLVQKYSLRLVCNGNTYVYENLKSENSQDYAQKPQRNSTFMNSASGQRSSAVAQREREREPDVARTRIFKLLRSPRINSKEPIPVCSLAVRTSTLFLLCSHQP
jgi:hypothetical protein